MENRMEAKKDLKQALKVLLIVMLAVIGAFLFIKVVLPIALLCIIFGAFSRLDWCEMYFITRLFK